ncbi:LY9 protein, partial [Leucopsar rothschildi]|nr:LY9 protein [Leucopsar rothschildi]
MDKFWIPLLATLVLLPQTRSSSGPQELIRAVGDSVTFLTPDTRDGHAFWSLENDPIVTASHEDPPQTLFSTDKFKKRFAVSEKGRALTVSQLTLEDSGTYSVTIGGKKSTFNLKVYNRLAEPTVTCEAQNCSGGSCHFSLRCSASGTGLGQVSYTWRVGDRPWDEGSMVLWVNKSSSREEEEEPLTCTARNPVSSWNVTVTTPDMFCTGESQEKVGIRDGMGILRL